LNAKYDVLIFVDGGIPAASQTSSTPLQIIPNVPAEYANQQGRVTTDKTMPEIKRFIESGGTVITIGDSSMNLAQYLRLPVENHLTENGQALPRTKFFTPGSLLSARVDTTHPIAHGMPEQSIFFFDNSPVFKLAQGAESEGVKAFATFDSKTPLRSGWSWGQHYLENGAIAVEARVGKGRALLFGPEILKRAQPHGTFKLLFNGIYYSAAEQP
jgi:hypothetical protein